MKKIIPVMAAFLLLTGCGSTGDKSAETTPETPEAPQASVSTQVEEKTLSGTMDEIKDFMFIVTDEDGRPMQFTFEDETPEGLDEAEVGDQVTVTYTGVVSDVDPFDGTVVSVEVEEAQ